MRLFPIVFEDQSCVNFRPLAWSQPVYELRCGLLNLRERLQQVLLDAAPPAAGPLPGRPGLLPRGLLQALQPRGSCAVGPQNCARELPRSERALWLTARLGARWDVLAALVGRALKGEDFAWRDELGLVAACLEATAAPALLRDWQAWEERCARAGCWQRAAGALPAWEAAVEDWPLRAEGVWGRLQTPEGADPAGPAALQAVLEAADRPPAVWRHLWDLIPANGPAIGGDVQKLVAAGRSLSRELFGIRVAEGAWPQGAPWLAESRWRCCARDRGWIAPEAIWLADDVQVAPAVAVDASRGPVVLDRGVIVQPFSYLEGPLYVGPGTLIKAGARISGETSLGAVCKVAGEVGESIFADFVNKQHDGFVGHAVLGCWVNLGAGTNNSDLKNNYGPVRVDLGRGPVDTGLRFLGLLMGEHSKSAIGTLFNTGTCVGFSCNVFASGFPPKLLPSFSWGQDGTTRYAVEPAIATARVVMSRRGVAFLEGHEALFRALAESGT